MSINLANMPLPPVIRELSYEDTLSELKAGLIRLYPDIEPILQLESAIVNKLMQNFAYYVVMLRAEMNDAAKALMLATAGGGDLDSFAADFDIQRLVVGQNADGSPIYEDDDDFRKRRQLAPGGYAVAGPEEAYKFHALSADGRVKEAEPVKGEGGRVDIILRGRDGDGSLPDEVIQNVFVALSPKTKRPLTDNVYVRSVSVVNQPVKVLVKIPTGPDEATVRDKVKASVEAYARDRSAIGSILRIDGIIGAAYSGNSLERVAVIEPSADVDPGAFGTVFVPSVVVEVERAQLVTTGASDG